MSISRVFNSHKRILFCLAFLAINTSFAQTSGQGTPAAFPGITDETRQFFLKAEAADNVADPLARCLAFPDMPGNKWPKELIKQTCEFNFGPAIRLTDVKRLLESGEVSKLDSLFAADLDRHFSRSGFSEIIHRDFYDFEKTLQSEALTKLWLDKAPDSPYALNARATYYRFKGWEARGNKFADGTSAENIKRMGEFFDLSVDLYQRALKIEPRLMPAYAGLINIGYADSRYDLLRGAIKNAKAVDPLCSSTIVNEMISLSPRWGGSYDSMQKRANDIAPHVDERPFLANSMIAHYADLADVLNRDRKFKETIELLTPVLAQNTDRAAYLALASALDNVDGKHGADAIVYLLTALRFNEGDSYNNRTLGRLLLMVGRQPKWASIYLQHAVDQNPEDNFAHLYLGKSYLYTNDLQNAESQFLLSMKEPKTRQDSLQDLGTIYMRIKQPEKALDVVTLLNKEYPTYAPGWLYSGRILQALNRPGWQEALQKFVDTTDRRNPGEAQKADMVKAELESLKQ